MPQYIRKFQEGGNIKKYGTFNYLGKEYDVTDDLIDNWGNYSDSSENDEVTNFRSMIAQGLRSMKESNTDSDILNIDANGIVSGTDTPMKAIKANYTPREQKKLSNVSKTGIGKFLESTFAPNSISQQFGRGANKSKNWAYTTKEVTKTPDALDILNGDDLTIEYDDKKKYIDNSINNSAIFKRLNTFTDMFTKGKDNAMKRFNLSKYNADRLFDWYDENPSKAQDYMYNIGERIKLNNLTNADKTFLNNFHILSDIPIVSTSDASVSNGNSSLGITPNEQTNLSKYMIFNNDGSISANPEFDWTWNGAIANENQWFNDAAIASGIPTVLKNWVKIGDKFYKADDAKNINSNLYKFLHNNNNEEGSDFYSLLANDNYEKANSLLESLWGQSHDWDRLDNSHYSNLLSGHKDWLFRNVTGKYDLSDLPEGSQLIYAIDPVNSESNSFGARQGNYYVLDQYGNIPTDARFSTTVNGISTPIIYDNYLGNRLKPLNADAQTTPTFNARYLYNMNNPNSPYYNRYFTGGTQNSNGEITSGSGFFIDASNKRTPILHFVNNNKSYNLKLTPEIYKIFKDNNILDKINNNPKAKNAFANQLETLTRSTVNFRHVLDPIAWFTDKFQWSKIIPGMSEDAVNSLRQYFTELGKYTKQESIYNNDTRFMYENPTTADSISKKNGGILKGADGLLMNLGNANGISSASTVTSISDKQPVDTEKLSTLIGKNANWKNLTNADKYQLASLVGDLASLGITIADPTNIAGAATGVASSLAAYRSDKERNVKGSVGNLLTNLALDTVTLVPILGDAAKVGKVANAVKKSASTLMRVFSLYGIANAGNAVAKIANGQGVTAEDLRIIAGGLSGIVGLNRLGGLGRNAKTKIVGKDVTIQPKATKSVNKFKINAKAGSNVADLELDGDAVKKILTSSKNDADIKLKLRQAAEKGVSNVDTVYDINDDVVKNLKIFKEKREGIKLSSQDTDEILAAKNKEAQKDLFIKKVAAAGGIDEATVRAEYNLDDFIKISNGWKILGFGKPIEANKIKDITGLTKSVITPIESNTALGNWWHGTGNYRSFGQPLFRDSIFKNNPNMTKVSTASPSVVTPTASPRVNVVTPANSKPWINPVGNIWDPYEDSVILFSPKNPYENDDAQFVIKRTTKPEIQPLVYTPGIVQQKKGGKILKAQFGNNLTFDDSTGRWTQNMPVTSKKWDSVLQKFVDSTRQAPAWFDETQNKWMQNNVSALTGNALTKAIKEAHQNTAAKTRAELGIGNDIKITDLTPLQQRALIRSENATNLVAPVVSKIQMPETKVSINPKKTIGLADTHTTTNSKIRLGDPINNQELYNPTPLLEGLKAIHSIVANNRINSKLKSMKPAYQVGRNHTFPRYQDPGYNAQVREQIARNKNLTIPTSDLRAAQAMNLQFGQGISKLASEAIDNTSKYITNYNAAHENALNQKYAEDTAIANNNITSLITKNAADKKYDAATMTGNAKSIDNLMSYINYNTDLKYKQQQNLLSSARNASDQQSIINEYNNDPDLKRINNEFKTAYALDNTLSFNDWLENNDYANLYNQKVQFYKNRLNAVQYKNSNWKSGITHNNAVVENEILLKSGGTAPYSYRRYRPFFEQLQIDNNKKILELITKANEDALKLYLKGIK